MPVPSPFTHFSADLEDFIRSVVRDELTRGGATAQALPAPTPDTTTSPASGSSAPDSDRDPLEVLDSLLEEMKQQRQNSPASQPSSESRGSSQESQVATPSPAVTPDKSVSFAQSLLKRVIQ